MDKDLNIKIYGVTTVGPKGQVIIPKEGRTDLGLIAGVEFEIVLVEKVAFGIGKTEECEGKAKKEDLDFEEYGFVNIGTKFQFVIPSSIRKELNINPGDSLIVIGKGKEGIGFIKNDRIEYLLDFIKEETSLKK